MVILNQETAIKWVNQELLKFSFNSFGRFSLAHNKIQDKNIASFLVYILLIVWINFSLKLYIFLYTLFISFFQIVS